jgi:hypothetical protein
MGKIARKTPRPIFRVESIWLVADRQFKVLSAASQGDPRPTQTNLSRVMLACVPQIEPPGNSRRRPRGLKLKRVRRITGLARPHPQIPVARTGVFGWPEAGKPRKPTYRAALLLL